MWKKSQAMVRPAWAFRNSDHDGPVVRRGRSQAVTAEELTDRGRRHPHPELAALAHDAQVAPSGVLTGQPQDEVADFLFQRVGGGTAALRVPPRPGDEVPVPSQQRGRRDQENTPALPAEQPGQAGQHGAVSGGVPRPCPPDGAARPAGGGARRSRRPSGPAKARAGGGQGAGARARASPSSPCRRSCQISKSLLKAKIL